MVSVSRPAAAPQRGQSTRRQESIFVRADPSLARDLDVAGQFHREVFLGHRNFAATRAVDHGNGSAPVALPGYPPVAEPPGDLRLAEAAFAGVFRHRPLGLLGRKTAERAGIHDGPVVHEGAFGIRCDIGVIRDDHRPDLQSVLRRELVVPFVVGRNRHHRSGSVLHEHVVRDEDRNLLSREGIYRPKASDDPRLFGLTGWVRFPGMTRQGVPQVFGHRRILGGDRLGGGMSGRQHQCGAP